MSTILLCKSENNMNINNNSIFQSASSVKEIEAETIRLKREEGGGILVQMSQTQVQSQQQSSGSLSDHDEKKMRRQIANSNERRRMQSINAGFQSLRQLLPHHEGEKLSKAAILQQTAEYIERLENERNQMIAQTQHLQRLVDSLGGGNNNNNNNECPQQIITSPSTGTVGAFKKRKLDQVVTVQTISDSSDEGLGSMSPEPVSQMILTNGSSGTITKTHMVSATSVTTINVKDYVNLQNQMETERRHRIQLEEQLRHLEMQVYSNQQATPAVAIAGQKYQIHEETEDVDIQPVGTVIEEKIILRQQPQQQQQQQQPEENSNIHYHVPHHQYVVVSTPGSSPKNIIMNDNDEDSRTLSSDELHKDEVKLVRKMSPKHQPREIRIPSILEKAIKAEPKVEVERISSPVIHINMIEEAAVQSPPRLTGSPTIRTTYPSNNQRPNLETIVEAIRHLEGDAAFDMDDGQEQQQSTKVQTPTTQEAPLALTTNNKYHQTSNNRSGNNIQEHNTQPFLKFRQTSTSQSGLPTFSVSVPSSQQQRPGVIVVKQSS